MLNIAYSISIASPGEIKRITWDRVKDIENVEDYHLQKFVDGEWIDIKGLFLRRQYNYKISNNDIGNMKFRVRASYINGTYGEWSEGKEFSIKNKDHGVDGSLTLPSTNTMGLEYNIIGVGDAYIEGTINIIIELEETLDGSLTLSRNVKHIEIPGEIVVGLGRDTSLPANLISLPTNSLKLSTEVIKPELKTKKFGVVEDTFIRESALHVNYGDLIEMMTWDKVDDGCITYISINIEYLDPSQYDIQNIYLHLGQLTKLSKGVNIMSIYEAGNNWGELWTTWFNRPPLGNIIKDGIIDASKTHYKIDLKDYYLELIDKGETQMNLAIVTDMPMTFLTREYGGELYAPYIGVDYYDKLLQGNKYGLEGTIIAKPKVEIGVPGSLYVNTDYVGHGLEGTLELDENKTVSEGIDGEIFLIFGSRSFLSGTVKMDMKNNSTGLEGTILPVIFDQNDINGSLDIYERDDSSFLNGTISVNVKDNTNLDGEIILNKNHIENSLVGSIVTLLNMSHDFEGEIALNEHEGYTGIESTVNIKNCEGHDIDGTIVLNRNDEINDMEGEIILPSYEENLNIVGEIIPRVKWYNDLEGTMHLIANAEHELYGKLTIPYNEASTVGLEGTIYVIKNSGYVFIM